MTECWSEGELRAYLDRELEPETQQQVALHLAECHECARVTGELEARAAFVWQRIGGLEPVMAAKRPARTRRWVAAALALAAGLAMAALLIPKHGGPPPAAPDGPRTATAAEMPQRREPAVRAPVVDPAGSEVLQPVRRPVRRAMAPARPAGANDGFVRLDDEPFETGVVVRVALGPQQVPADVIFGSDGRPRAIRLVSFK